MNMFDEMIPYSVGSFDMDKILDSFCRELDAKPNPDIVLNVQLLGISVKQFNDIFLPRLKESYKYEEK